MAADAWDLIHAERAAWPTTSSGSAKSMGDPGNVLGR